MIPFNIDYEGALDFEHCENMNQAISKLSQLTNLINRVMSIRHQAKKDLLEECAMYPEEKMYKLSWDNKIVCLLCASNREQYVVDTIDLFSKSDEAFKKLKFKHQQVVEDLMKLKKQADITPH